MGQQQLLLLVMGIVIVGLAIVTSLDIAEKSLMQNDADVLVGRCLTIAQDAVYWKSKTNPFVGGNAAYTDLATGGFSHLFLLDETENGYFKFDEVEANSFKIIAVSKRFPLVGVKISVVGEEIVSTESSVSGAITLP